VASSATLTIEPGVEVKFDGFYSIYVDGTIIAIGNESNRINITSNSINPIPGDWNTIQINLKGHSEIKDCNINYGSTGVSLQSSYNNITNNNVSLNSNHGLFLSYSTGNNIIGNIAFSNNQDGIQVHYSDWNLIKENKVDHNSLGILIYMSNGNIVKSNNASYNSAGIQIWSASESNNITDNILTFNTNRGLWLDWSNGNNITYNNISSNLAEGIRLSSSNGNSITGNTISNNGFFGFFLVSSLNNRIYHNNIIDNADQAFDDTNTGNQWDNGYPSGGNYWSDWTTPDVMSGPNQDIPGSDGIVDNPYVIDPDSRDYYPLVNPVDTSPPTITNLQPPDASTTNDNTPMIGADYSDSSGINLSSVVLEVDGIDVTLSAVVTASGVTYTPGTALSDGIHMVYLEVKDNAGNLATVTWSFNVDTKPPIITNLQPPNLSTMNKSMPTISANYSDPSGIDVSSVILEVDGVDVTSSATVIISGVSYIPGTALPEGIHAVYLEVKDNVGNLATVTWTFTVDTTPPIITNVRPPNASTTNDSTPIISADYSDSSGINVSSVLLEVDGIEVTSSAVVIANNVTYIPGTVLSDGIHTVYLEVKDNVNNLATASWTFTVDITPPIIILIAPGNNSIIPSGTILDFNITDPNLTQVNYSINGGADFPFSDPYDLSTGGWTDGNYTVQINALDLVGNSNSFWYFFTIDSNPPTIILNAPVNNSVIPDGTILDFTVFDLTSFQANYSINGGANIPFSDPFDISTAGLVDGDYVVQINALDFLGHSNSSWYFFTIDSSPPVITNLQPPDTSTTNDNTSTISADYSDLSGINISSVLLEVDGLDMTSSAMVYATNVTYLPVTALSDGIHTVYLEVRDDINNLASATWSFTVDTTSPITTISPDIYTVKLGTLFTLTATDGVGGCGVNYTQYKIDDGNWIDYLAPFSIDTYEYHNITYRSMDNLGNVENENTLSIYVPKVPMTTLNIGTPQYGTTPRYVNQFTQFSFSVIDYSGTGYDTCYYIDTSSPIIYVGPFTVSTEGTHTIYYYSNDKLGNIEDTKEFDIIVDNTPPTTDIDIGDSYYAFGDTWVTSATGFTLNAIDGGMIPVGVNHTKYRIWNGGVWTSWISYAGGFSLGTNEGVSYLEYYSIDWLGNEEPFQNRTFIIDNTPPATTISVGDPKYKSDLSNIWNVTSATTYVLSAMDDGAGLNYTEYRIWDNGSWSNWNRYTDGFRLGADNSTRYVEWFSVDYLGNKGMTRNETYFVDNIPPETNYLLLLESDNTEARLSLIPSDVGSGVDFTKYRINSGDWINYSDTFVLNESGEHVVYFWSTDKLGNIEDTKEITVLVEKPETPTPSDEGKKEANNKPLIALIFAIILLLVGSYVSYKRPLNFKGEVTKDRLLTWFIVVLPFVIAEIVTGVVSLVTGMLSVPPLLGVGMIVDTAILVGGLAADGFTFKKGQKIDEESPEL
jgi:parallel beta-helix repeat protein